MYDSLFIHSSTEEHLSCFQVLAFMNKAAMNIHGQELVWTYIFKSFGSMPGSMVAESYGKSLFSFVRSHQVVCHFAFPPAMNESSCCSTSLSAFGVVSVPDFRHSEGVYWCLLVVVVVFFFF